jgi:NAD+ synthase (glutamine-hydrolysing)
MNRLGVCLAQINSAVGDLHGNRYRIQQGIEEARQRGAHLAVFPELAISGYPPEDLLLKPRFVGTCQKVLDQVVENCEGVVAVVGFPELQEDRYDSAAIICDRKIAGVCRKRFLPNYSVFGGSGWTFGVSICEDIWYATGPPEQQASVGSGQLLINPSASPFHIGKDESRERMLVTRAADCVAAVAFCNLVGVQDELVFDGGSAVLDSLVNLLALGKKFQEDSVIADISIDNVIRRRLLDTRWRKVRSRDDRRGSSVAHLGLNGAGFRANFPPCPERPLQRLSEVATTYQALVLGTKESVNKNRFQKVVVGLSGEIDSSLTACVAVDALGPDNVVGVSMLSRYPSGRSKDDSGKLAQALGIRFLTAPIEPVFLSFLNTLAEASDDCQPDSTEENLQARIRGTILMALSNKFNLVSSDHRQQE